MAKKRKSIRKKTSLSEKELKKDFLVDAVDDIEINLIDLEAKKHIVHRKIIFLKAKKMSLNSNNISNKKEVYILDKRIKELQKNLKFLNKKILEASGLEEELIG